MELSLARGFIAKLSESSDILFIISRSKYDGYPIRDLPSLKVPRNALAYAYMIFKFTGRWGFYRVVARNCGKADWKTVREVINPRKEFKLVEVAVRHGIEAHQFKRVAKRLLKVWPLLP
jgi:hypothetical protein